MTISGPVVPAKGNFGYLKLGAFAHSYISTRPLRTSKMDSFATIVNGFILHRLTHHVLPSTNPSVPFFPQLFDKVEIEKLKQE